jgi:hypothetical protein
MRLDLEHHSLRSDEVLADDLSDDSQTVPGPIQQRDKDSDSVNGRVPARTDGLPGQHAADMTCSSPAPASIQVDTHHRNNNVRGADVTPAPDGIVAPAIQPRQVHAARLVQDAAQFRVGMRTESFGSVDVHTSIASKQVEIQMGSERGDLHDFFLAELPSLQSTLRQHDLQLGDVRTLSQTGNPGFDFSQDSGRQQHFLRQHSREAQAARELQPAEISLIEGRAGLDIRI